MVPQHVALSASFIEEKTMLKKCVGAVLLLLFSSALVASVSGCNTVKGVGEDVERGGQKLENAADRSK